ncbi:flagellar biosynthesis protein FlhF [Filobacillus milosensis]|uniref:Flagellar biosynthesis protein FlhF n=1 Tax=Filobacillus milosensis TaxID=94137 RepID=A0A4Y8INS5_9BACI|nr:flagellar biosynthesis protein FlhF [Filobacillus milosensis]TFB23195.1 flagellar biosynthesis protein FlhF [Filobacillus milosensis]
MKVKKYTAPTMPEAMKVVRNELGQSAVILNSREQKTKGFLGFFRKKYIEVFAAVDPNPIMSHKKASNKVDRIYQKPKQEEDRSLNDEILKEINQLKTQVNQQKTNKNVLPDPIQVIYKHLEEQEINKDEIDEMLPFLLEKYYSNDKNDDKQLKRYVKQYLLEKMDSAFAHHKHHAKFIYLFGPTGVGKTTTIAKLAALSSITDDKKIAFITLDTYRIAAIDQLKTYAKILNVPIEVAYNKDDFKKAKDRFKDYDVIFIDSAGRNFRKDEYINQVKDFVEFSENEEIYCVLSLTSKSKDLEDIFTRFNQLNVNRVIFTKADETSQYGAIFNLWNKHKFKISYVTYGQSVPDDIQEASPELIVDLLVGEKQW